MSLRQSARASGARLAVALAAASLMTSPAPMLRADQQTNATPPSIKIEEKKEYVTTLGIILSQDTKAIKCDITAIKQQEGSTCYLINGQGDNGVWYQFGLGHKAENSFMVDVQAWQGREMLEYKSMKATVSEGDKITIGMFVTNGSVLMSIKDEKWPSKFDIPLTHQPILTTFKGFSREQKEEVHAGGKLSNIQIGTSIFTEIHSSNYCTNLSTQLYNIKEPKIENFFVPFALVSWDYKSKVINTPQSTQASYAKVVDPYVYEQHRKNPTFDDFLENLQNPKRPMAEVGVLNLDVKVFSASSFSTGTIRTDNLVSIADAKKQ